MNNAFCGTCGTKRRFSNSEVAPPDMGSEEDLVKFYHSKGYTYEVILQFLRKYHGVLLSLSSLKRRLRDFGLRKREILGDEDRIREIVRRELQGPGSLLGYRGMHTKLRTTYKENQGD